jgi:hydrogenase small subunit
VIHDHCPRRAHFDAGRFAREFGDEGHRQGWCLYRLGCKGPVTHAACSTRHFNEVPDVWPIGIGSPCVGCTEKGIAFNTPIFQTAELRGVTPPEALPLINTPIGKVGPIAAGMVGAIAGGIGGAALMASRRLPTGKEMSAITSDPDDKSKPEAGAPGGD